MHGRIGLTWVLVVYTVALLALCARTGALGNEALAPATAPLELEVFVREGCPHCEKAEAFLADLAAQRPELRLNIHDIVREPASLERLKALADALKVAPIRVPAIYLGGQLFIGYTDEATTGKLILDALDRPRQPVSGTAGGAGSCEAEESLSCGPDTATSDKIPERFEVNFLGRPVGLDEVGLPLFTLVMGLLDGFNPCSMWVLVLMISLLAPMNNRQRMLAIAGTFVLVEGLAYFLFMAAWLKLFLLIGLSRASELIIAGIALLAGAIHIKDFIAYGWGVSLSIPESAKPGIYQGIRRILQAENLTGALIGAVLLAVLVQVVEFLCTSGFPALYTRILTLRALEPVSYYGYLLLYNLAYMLDDLLVLGVGVLTLSQRRLQEREGRWLKLLSGLVMIGLGAYLIVSP